MLSHKKDVRSNSESGGSLCGGGLGRDGLVQQRKGNEKRNPDVDPRLRVIERFRIFFSQANRYSITCPKRVNDK